MNKRHKLFSLLIGAVIVASVFPSSGTGATSESIAFYNSKKSILEMKEYDEAYDTNHDGVVNVFDVIRENKEVFQEESYTDLKSQIHSLETQIEILTQKLAEKEDKTQVESNLSEINSVLSGKVDIQEGKQLSINDYTNEEKQKLESLNNYDDTKINEKIDSLVQTAYEEKKVVESSIQNKVDKEEGKQLSSNDYTDEEKQKLESLNNYDDEYLKNTIDNINDDLINNKYYENPLYGKTIIFDGDSICEAIYTDSKNKGGYSGRIINNNNMIGYNYAIGGGTITKDVNDYNGNIKHSICENIDKLYYDYPDADYIILEGGTNDADLIGSILNGNVPEKYGNYNLTDYSGNYDNTTFCGAIEELLYKSSTYWKGKKIGFVIAMKMGPASNGYDKENNNRRAYFETIMNICKKWGVPCLNLWDECYMNPSILSHYDISKTKDENILCGSLYVDGQHPTTYGYDYISSIIESWLKTL